MLLTPNTEWGGEGSLGCGIGYGYLHRIPEKDVECDPVDPEVGAVDLPDGSMGVEPNTAPPTSATSGGEGFAEVSKRHVLVCCVMSPFPPLKVPLSVPSQPGTPGQSAPPPPNEPQRVGVASDATCLPPPSSVETGIQQLTLTESPQATPTLPESLTPAPVTVVRSTPRQGHAHMSHPPGHPPITTLPSAMPPSSLPGMLSQHFNPSAVPRYASIPMTTGTSQDNYTALQSMGLPPAPPTISLPTVAPTISLGPTPNLIPSSST